MPNWDGPQPGARGWTIWSSLLPPAMTPYSLAEDSSSVRIPPGLASQLSICGPGPYCRGASGSIAGRSIASTVDPASFPWCSMVPVCTSLAVSISLVTRYVQAWQRSISPQPLQRRGIPTSRCPLQADPPSCGRWRARRQPFTWPGSATALVGASTYTPAQSTDELDWRCHGHQTPTSILLLSRRVVARSMLVARSRASAPLSAARGWLRSIYAPAP